MRSVSTFQLLCHQNLTVQLNSLISYPGSRTGNTLVRIRLCDRARQRRLGFLLVDPQPDAHSHTIRVQNVQVFWTTENHTVCFRCPVSTASTINISEMVQSHVSYLTWCHFLENPVPEFGRFTMYVIFLSTYVGNYQFTVLHLTFCIQARVHNVLLQSNLMNFSTALSIQGVVFSIHLIDLEGKI